MAGRDDFRSPVIPGAVANPGFNEGASPYAAEPRSIKAMDEATLMTLTGDCSRTVESAITAHLDAGRTVYSHKGDEITMFARPQPK